MTTSIMAVEPDLSLVLDGLGSDKSRARSKERELSDEGSRFVTSGVCGV